MSDFIPVDIGNAGNTCSDNSSTESSPDKFIRKLKRKIRERNLSESESEKGIFCKRSRVDDIPKYYPGNSIQNQEGFFSCCSNLLSDEESSDNGHDNNKVCTDKPPGNCDQGTTLDR